MIARLNCVTDEAVRRAKQGRQRPGWPLSLRDSEAKDALNLSEGGVSR
jgi:hypothetical protein